MAGAKKPSTVGEGKVELGLVVRAIEMALDEAAQNPVAGFPPLESVNVEVTTTTANEIGGGVKLLVVNIGGKTSAKNVTSMSFELKPPEEKAPATKLSSVNIDEI
jgi:hypothetical protein